MSEKTKFTITSFRWVFLLKICTFMVVMGCALFALGVPRFIQGPTLIYVILTLYIPIAFFLRPKVVTPSMERIILTLQLAVELIVVVGIISATGANLSPFTGLFYLTIISGALYYDLIGALVVATMAAAGHVMVGWFGLSFETLAVNERNLLLALKQIPDDVFFAMFLHTLTYYLVAFVSAYFSVRVRSSDRELEFASRALSHARFQTDEIMRKLSAGLVTVDYAGKIVLFNRAAEMILETPEKTVKGKDYRRVLSGRTVELGRELRMVLDNGVGRPRVEVEIERLDGTFMPLGVSTATISGGEEGALGVIAIFQDISLTKALEEKVRRNDRLAAVGELSASIAHEIRNPLAAIAGSAQVLAKERNEGESRFSSEGDRLLELIIKESARLNRILGDFLSYARIGRIAYNKVDLCHVVVEALEMIRQHPSYDPDIEFSFLSTQSVIYVVGDKDQMKQIVFNLVLNAFEALGSVCSASKKIEIAVLRLPEGERTLLSIHDNGPGIPRKALSKIFTPFYSTRNSGTGLGLAIVYRLSESMKASLEVESSEGSGATFYLKFLNYHESGVSPVDQVAKTKQNPVSAAE